MIFRRELDQVGGFSLNKHCRFPRNMNFLEAALRTKVSRKICPTSRDRGGEKSVGKWPKLRLSPYVRGRIKE